MVSIIQNHVLLQFKAYLPIAYGLPLFNLGKFKISNTYLLLSSYNRFKSIYQQLIIPPFTGFTFYRYAEDYGTDPRGFLGWTNDTKLCMFMVMIPASVVSLFLCLIIMFNLSTPQTRKIGVVDKLESQGQSLTVLVFLSCVNWGFAYPTYMRYPDIENPNFYPIFKILNAFFGLLIFAFMGLFSPHFRKEVSAGSGSQIAFLKYMVSEDKTRPESGMSSRTISSTSLNSADARDSLDEDSDSDMSSNFSPDDTSEDEGNDKDVEKGNMEGKTNDDNDSVDSLDNDDRNDDKDSLDDEFSD